MLIQELQIPGAALIRLEEIADERGFFARAWCEREFREHGLNPRIAQVNLSHNTHRGTLRGMHYQRKPFEETKVVRCVRGAIFDVLVDLRAGSPTRGRWYGTELSDSNRAMLVVPEGCAHGFIALEDNTDVLYQVSEFYTAGAESGFRWNDSAFGIQWPLEPVVISEKDAAWPDFELDSLQVTTGARS